MRTLAFGLIAAGVALATPAFAEDFYVGGRGVGVEVDSGYTRDRDWRRDRYRTEGFERRGFERCSTTIIRRDDGSVRRIRRCRD